MMYYCAIAEYGTLCDFTTCDNIEDARRWASGEMVFIKSNKGFVYTISKEELDGYCKELEKTTSKFDVAEVHKAFAEFVKEHGTLVEEVVQ